MILPTKSAGLIKILSIILLCFFSWESFADTIRIDPTITRKNITGETLLWIDSTGIIDPELVPDKYFSQVETDGLREGFSPYSFWLKINLFNSDTTARHFVIQATNWFIDEADLYTFSHAKMIRIAQSGDLLPFAKREIKSKFPGFKIHLHPGEVKTYFLKIRNTQFNQFSILLFDINFYYQTREDGDSKELITGLILMRFAFHLSLLVFLYREKFLRVFSYWGIFLCAVYFFSSGYAGFVFSESAYLTNKAFYFVVSFAPLALCYYIYTIFELKKYAPWIRWVYGSLIAVGFLNLVCTFFVHHWILSWSYIIFMALMVSFHLISCIYFYFRFTKPSFWYVSTLFLYLPAFSFYYLRNAGFINSDLEFNIIQFTFFLDFLTVSFITAAQLKLRKSENVRLQESVYLKQQEAKQLAKLDKLKTEFFMNISHEFRTPLSLMLGPVKTLTQKYPAEALLFTIKRNAERLQQLINQTLDFSRLESGGEKPRPQKGDIVLFIKKVVENFSVWLAEKNINLILNVNESSLEAVFDSDKLDKIVTNLLSNALKYSNDNTIINIDVKFEKNVMVMIISDQGIGIPEDKLPFIFNRYYQVNESTAKGTGLGLALVKDLIHLLGGSIEVESVEGIGSKFKVTIPFMSVLEPISDEKPGVDKKITSSFGDEFVSTAKTENTILVVEDNQDLLLYLTEILSPFYNVVVAENGFEGKALINDGLCPDLILSDVMMPVMDGYELCQFVKNSPATSHVPFILLTARSSQGAKIEGLNRGADAYISKPFDPDELMLLIKNLQSLQESYRKVFERMSTQVGNESKTEEPIPESLQTDWALIKGLNAYLELNYSDSELTLEDICKKAGIGKTHLTHKFSTLTGITPIQYLRNIRMEKARVLLSESNKTIADVAYSVGFNDAKYFSKQFAQTFGVLPSQFREEAREN